MKSSELHDPDRGQSTGEVPEGRELWTEGAARRPVWIKDDKEVKIWFKMQLRRKH